MTGLTFGIIDNAVMILGAYTGLQAENILPARYRRGLGAVIGAGIGNAISDFLGGLGEGNLPLAIGTFTGCILALGIVPIVECIKAKRPERGK